MQNLLLAVDRLSTWIGKVFAWTIVGLTLLISWEVFSRYVMNKPHAWMLDAQIMLYGTLFMTAGAYTLSKNGHVRGDVLYGFFKPRTQATIDLLLYIVFFLPGIVALTWAGWSYAQESLAIREQTFNADPLPVYPFKFVIPLSGGILLLQGIVEIIRCVNCLRTGAWPARDEDVEEVDVDKLKEMVHVKDEDIQALDRGLIDAAEVNNASSDRELGFADVAKNCMLQRFHQSAEQFEILFNGQKYRALPQELRSIVDYAVQAASADMSWKAIDRNSKDYIELKKAGVKFYKTPDAILRAQLASWDKTVAKQSAENPLFKKVLDSQRQFAERAGQWQNDYSVDLKMAYDHYFSGKKS